MLQKKTMYRVVNYAQLYFTWKFQEVCHINRSCNVCFNIKLLFIPVMLKYILIDYCSTSTNQFAIICHGNDNPV